MLENYFIFCLSLFFSCEYEDFDDNKDIETPLAMLMVLQPFQELITLTNVWIMI